MISNKCIWGTMMRLNNQVIYDFWPLENIPVTVKKIHDFKKLGKGWSYGEGEPFKDSILNNAISLIREAFNLAFYTTDTFPGLNGEVMCTIYYSNHYLEFILEPDGDVTFTREKGDEEICYQEGLSLQDAKEKIRELRKETWNTYESSTPDTIMTVENTDLQALRLGIREKTPEYQSLTSTASLNPGPLYASTY